MAARKSSCNACRSRVRSVHLRLKEANTAARLVFRAIERGVGIGDETGRVASVVGIHGDADADVRRGHGRPRGHEVLGAGGREPFGQGLRSGGLVRAGQRGR